MSQTDQELDRIERSIEIDATAEKVWSLLERPGWWINEHDVDPDPVIRWEDDETAVVVHETWGEFRLVRRASDVGSSRVDLQACKLEYSIVSPK